MNIQGNINQTISLAGLLFSQTPMAAAAREKAIEQQKIKTLEKDLEQKEISTEQALKAVEDIDKQKLSPSEEEARFQLYGEASAKELKTQEELFYANPTEENARALVRSKGALADWKQTEKEEIEKKAEDALKKEQERIKSSKLRSQILTGTPAETTKILSEAKLKKITHSNINKEKGV